MAKVKIQGHASGTGVLTVTAPNTSTDRTITLPDSTDTLAVNSDVTNKLPLAGGTMTGDLVVSADVDITGSLNGTSGALDIKNEANNQNVFIKTTSAGSEVTALKIHSGGVLELPSGGLRVGGTAAANTLDDYEEGTWTPGFEGATISGNNGVGYYTKIGNVVYITYYTGGISISNQSGAARITGLPFTVLSDSSQYSTFYYSHGTAVADSVGGHFTTGQTKMQFVVYNATANAPWVNGTRYAMVSGIYLTTA